MVQLYFTSQMTFFFHPKKQKSTRTSSFPHVVTEKLKYFNSCVSALERENLPHGRHFFTFRSLVRTKGAFRLDAKQREATRSNQNLTSSTARERLKPGHNLSRAVDDVKFWLLRVQSKRTLKVNLHSIRFSYVFVRFFTFLLLLDKVCAFSSAFL